MIDTPCIIFAGGRSSRMGKDKALLPFSTFSTLTQYQYSRLSKIFKTVYISTKNPSKFNFDAKYIQDEKKLEIYAPTIGFISAFNYLNVDSFFAISVDSPFIDKNIIEQLFQNDKINNDATISETDFGIQPLCGIYHRSIQDKFIKMYKENNHKLGYLLKNANTTFVYFTNTKAFLNLNHPHEYEEAKQIINTSLV